MDSGDVTEADVKRRNQKKAVSERSVINIVVKV